MNGNFFIEHLMYFSIIYIYKGYAGGKGYVFYHSDPSGFQTVYDSFFSFRHPYGLAVWILYTHILWEA